MASKHYTHLGQYSDWVDAAKRAQPLWPVAKPGPETQAIARALLSVGNMAAEPTDLTVDQRWERDGVAGEAVSWSVGYGPRTQAWFFKPAGATGRLPGVLALHDHGGFKFFGKEKVADGPDAAVNELPLLREFRAGCYGGRAYVNDLARAGFAVLVHDTFLWGSRRWAEADMPEDMQAEIPPAADLEASIKRYNALTTPHEHLVAKYCTMLGTSFAGVVCYEDRVALSYLRSRSEVRAEALACLGLSGGGNRAAMLLATAEQPLAAAAIVGLMCTYEGMLDHNVFSHTWMLWPPGLSPKMDWSDLAACRAPAPLLVQYDEGDELFTLEGMRAAHARIAGHYAGIGRAEAYAGQFYPGPHKFDLPMQAAAFGWLAKALK